MRWTHWLVPLVAASSIGCLTPRSAGFGQTAASLAPGGVDVGVSGGVAYQSSTSQPQTNGGVTQTSTTNGWTLPNVESNVLVGLAENVGLNVHVSPAGLQPGVKWTVLQGPVSIAVLPAVAAGYASIGGSTTASTSGGTTSVTTNAPGTQLTFLAGLKAIASFDFGLYAGLGYDFEYVNEVAPPTTVGSSTTTTASTAQLHNLLAAVGYQFSFGAVHLRPEIAFLWTPASSGSTSSTNGGTTNTTNTTGTTSVYLFPNVTVAIDSGPRH